MLSSHTNTLKSLEGSCPAEAAQEPCFISPAPRGCSPTALSAEVLQDLGQVPAVGQVSHGPGAVWDQQGVVPSPWSGGKQELIVGQVKNPKSLTINPLHIWREKKKKDKTA